MKSWTLDFLIFPFVRYTSSQSRYLQKKKTKLINFSKHDKCKQKTASDFFKQFIFGVFLNNERYRQILGRVVA